MDKIFSIDRLKNFFDTNGWTQYVAELDELIDVNDIKAVYHNGLIISEDFVNKIIVFTTHKLYEFNANRVEDFELSVTDISSLKDINLTLDSTSNIELAFKSERKEYILSSNKDAKYKKYKNYNKRIIEIFKVINKGI